MYKHMHYVKFAYKYMISNCNMPESSRNPKPCACDLWGWLVVTGIRMWIIWDLQHTFSPLKPDIEIIRALYTIPAIFQSIKIFVWKLWKTEQPQKKPHNRIYILKHIFILISKFLSSQPAFFQYSWYCFVFKNPMYLHLLIVTISNIRIIFLRA